MTKQKQPNKDKSRNQKYKLQRIERGLLDEVSKMAPRFRRNTGEMLNTILAFGLSQWKVSDACQKCLNTQTV
jgi:hypothetical protein